MQGGDNLAGAKEILARAAVAALLNAATPSVNYPLSVSQVISQVTNAFNSGSRDTIIALAGILDTYNNLSES